MHSLNNKVSTMCIIQSRMTGYRFYWPKQEGLSELSWVGQRWPCPYTHALLVIRCGPPWERTGPWVRQLSAAEMTSEGLGDRRMLVAALLSTWGSLSLKRRSGQHISATHGWSRLEIRISPFGRQNSDTQTSSSQNPLPLLETTEDPKNVYMLYVYL